MGSREANGFSDEAAESAFEALLDPAVRPDYDWNHIAVGARFVEHGLAQLDAALFVGDAFGVPFRRSFTQASQPRIV